MVGIKPLIFGSKSGQLVTMPNVIWVDLKNKAILEFFNNITWVPQNPGPTQTVPKKIMCFINVLLTWLGTQKCLSYPISSCSTLTAIYGWACVTRFSQWLWFTLIYVQKYYYYTQFCWNQEVLLFLLLVCKLMINNMRTMNDTGNTAGWLLVETTNKAIIDTSISTWYW